MSDFRTDGFLGDVSNWTAVYHRHFLPLLTAYRELNLFAQDVFFRCDVPSNDQRRLSREDPLLSGFLVTFRLSICSPSAEWKQKRKFWRDHFARALLLSLPFTRMKVLPSGTSSIVTHRVFRKLSPLLDSNSELITAETRAELVIERARSKTDKSIDKKNILKPWQIAQDSRR